MAWLSAARAILSLLCLSCCLQIAPAQEPATSPAASTLCDVSAKYTVEVAKNATAPTGDGKALYAFSAFIILSNNVPETDPLKWNLTVDFQYGELITKVIGASTFPNIIKDAKTGATIPYRGSQLTLLPAGKGLASGDTSTIAIEGVRTSPADGIILETFPKGLTLNTPTPMTGCSGGNPEGADSSLNLCCTAAVKTPKFRQANVSNCDGVIVEYILSPAVPDPAEPGQLGLSYTATMTLNNTGLFDVSDWAAFLSYANNETVTAVWGQGTTPEKLPMLGKDIIFINRLDQTLMAAGIVRKDLTPFANTVFIKGKGMALTPKQAVGLPTGITMYFNRDYTPCRPAPLLNVTNGSTRTRICCITTPGPGMAPGRSPIPQVGSSVDAVAPAQYGAIRTGRCRGIYLQYIVNSLAKIESFMDDDPNNMTYRFDATMLLANFGSKDLKAWRVAINYTNDELITELSQVYVDQTLPAPGASLIFRPVPYVNDKLLTTINAAGAKNKYQAITKISGTLFGANDTILALPKALQLIARKYKCGESLYTPGIGNSMGVCCLEDSKAPPSPRDPKKSTMDNGYVEVKIDIVNSNNLDYWALVTIDNKQPFRRIDPPGWELSFNWRENEFIWEMKGAYAVNAGDCLNAKAVEDYEESIQFAHSCENPVTIRDLPPNRYDQESPPDYGKDGQLLNCCKNGTIGIDSITGGDPLFKDYKGKNASVAMFRMKVGKMKGQSGYDVLIPPFNISLGIPGYTCDEIEPDDEKTIFTLDLETGRTKEAYMTWTSRCTFNPEKVIPKCCVSFSAFYNRTGWTLDNQRGTPRAAPCKACACGGCVNPLTNETTCTNVTTQTKSQVTANPMFLAARRGWRKLIGKTKTPICADNCGQQVHWHVRKAYPGGWQAKMTIINKSPVPVKHWFIAFELEALYNLTSVYSFASRNYTEDRVQLMWGFPAFNDWLVGTKGMRQKDIGNVQSLIQFGHDPSFNLSLGDAFPKKFIFNGDVCVMPSFEITGATTRKYTLSFGSRLAAFLLILLNLILTIGLLH